MVFTGGVLQVAALCALALSSLPSLEAKRPTLAPTKSTVCGNSEGNKRFGVQAINDDSCVKGGLGCFNDHCRYCKVLDTPKSSHLNTCLSYGVVFTSTTPVAVVQGPCTVSSGDVAAGISAVTDSGCLNRGLGCYNDHCRYCKVTETTQSAGFMACSSLDSSYNTPAPTTAAPTTTAPTVAPTTTLPPTVVEPTTEAPTTVVEVPTSTPTAVVDPVTEAPTVIVDVPTSTPTVTEAPTVIVDVPTATPTVAVTVAPTITSTCTIVPSSGDVDAGVNIVTDLSCAVGGLGCLSDVCRFCKVKTTLQSDAYMDCALVNGEPTPTTEAPVIDTAAPTIPDATTEAPIVTTVDTVTPEVPDATLETPASTTVTPDLGTETPASTTEVPIVPDATTEAPPVTDTPTDAPTVSTDAPTATTAATAADLPGSTTEDPATTCTLVSSDEDVELGISVGTDPSCKSGGVGCIDDICRFCKLTTTLQSSLYVDCASLGNGSQSASTGEVPTETPDGTTETPTLVTTDTPDATTEAPITFTDVSTTETPADTPTVAPVTTDSPVSTTMVSTGAPAQETCGIHAAEGDIAVGIHIATDASCITGGVGCINDLCRFCKVENTPQSEAFVDCSTLAGISDTAAPVDVVTTAPASTVPTATCDLVASSGDASVGIQVITDASCSTGGVGCISDVCRFCKVITSVQSAAFIDCVTVDGYASETESPTTATPVVPASSTTCTQAASDGDLAVGVDITTDISCLFGGVGCIDTVCRFCQTTATSQSAAFPICTTISDYTPRPVVPVDTPSSTDAPVDQATCSLVVSAGDAANGISITGDAACAAGGVGCIDNVCRFCKVTTTVQSAGFVDCTSIAGFALASDVPTDTTAPSAVSTIIGTDTTTPVASCGLVVAEGDAAVGINIIADSTCQFGGVGCIDNVCRFCKVRTTEQSAAFVDCPIAVVPTVTSPVVVLDATTAPTNSGVDTSDVTPNDTIVPVDTEAPGTDFVTKSPDTTSNVSEAPGSTPTDSSAASSSVDVDSTSSDAVDAVTDSPTTTSDATTNTPSAASNAVDTSVPGSDGTTLTEAPVVDTESPSTTSTSNDSTTPPRTEEPTAVVDTSDLLTDAPVGTAGPSTNAPVSDVDVDDDIDWDGSDESEGDSDSTYFDSEESTDGL